MVIRWYIRPDTRHSIKRQREICESFCLRNDHKAVFYVEENRSRGAPYPKRNDWVKSLRGVEVCGVSDFHRLASTSLDLRAILSDLLASNRVVIEAASGRRTDNAKDLSDMILETTTFFANKGLTTQEASTLGKLGALVSPATKRKRGRMPMADAMVIWRDAALTTRQAVAKINEESDKAGYKDLYNHSWAYRNLKPRGVPAGRRENLNGHKKAERGNVYFVQRADNRRIKIGYTTKPLGRIKALQQGTDGDVAFLLVFRGDRAMEKELHYIFREYQVRGEWFEYGEKVKEFVMRQKRSNKAAAEYRARQAKLAKRKTRGSV